MIKLMAKTIYLKSFISRILAWLHYTLFKVKVLGFVSG